MTSEPAQLAFLRDVSAAYEWVRQCVDRIAHLRARRSRPNPAGGLPLKTISLALPGRPTDSTLLSVWRRLAGKRPPLDEFAATNRLAAAIREVELVHED